MSIQNKTPKQLMLNALTALYLAVDGSIADSVKSYVLTYVNPLEQEHEKLKNRFDGLRSLLGYVQDSSDVTVKLYQDDATRSYFVEVGKTSYYGDSFEEALDKAIAGDKS